MDETRISHYQLGRLLGRGGMGEVYEAVDLDLDRRVALKFVAPELAADAESLKRFEREARSAAALSHPHLATLYAFERDGGRSFIAMELMSGVSLRDRLGGGPLPVGEALALARDVASALAHAHRRGIVHRDIKPENLMFDPDGAIKITDFGLARAAQASRMTMTGTSLGTAAYMAPESVRGTTGAPADVFALGIVLHELIAGSLPFTGDSPLALLYTIANQEPVPLRAAQPDVPEEVEALVQRMLVKDPEQRPDAAAVARELSALTGVAPPAGLEAAMVPADTGGADGGSSGAGVSGARTEELETVPVPGGGRALAQVDRALAAAERTRPRRVAMVWIGLLLLVAVAGAAVLLWSGLVQRNREQALVLNNRGFEALQHDSLETARGLLETALAKSPRYGQAMLNLGLVYHRLEQDTRAAVLYGDALKADPRDTAVVAQALYGLAAIDMKSGAWPSAVGRLQQSVALDSSAAGFNNLSYALIRAGRATEAQRVLALGIARYPGEAMLHKNAGLAALQFGDFPGALSALDRALSLDSNLAEAWGLRARAHARLGDRTTALKDWQTFLTKNPDPETLGAVESDLRALRVVTGHTGHPTPP